MIKGRILVVVVAFTVAVALSGVVNAASPDRGGAEKPTVPGEIERVVSIRYLTEPPHNPPPTYDDTQEDYRLRDKARWVGVDYVPYWVNPANQDGLSTTDVVANARLAFDEWNTGPLDRWGLPTSFMGYAYQGTTDSTIGGTVDDPERDGYNVVFFADLTGTWLEGVVAVCWLWYNRATKQMIEFDIILNDAYTWSIGATATSLDLQNELTHEAGHGLVLYDLNPPKDRWLTMYYATWYDNEDHRTIGKGDAMGIQALYPPVDSTD